jgi:PAS domain S-box-containing protein
MAVARLADPGLSGVRQGAVPALAARILEVVRDAVIAVDGAGAVTYWNAGAERLLSVPANQAMGKGLPGLVPDGRAGRSRAAARRDLRWGGCGKATSASACAVASPRSSM